MDPLLIDTEAPDEREFPWYGPLVPDVVRADIYLRATNVVNRFALYWQNDDGSPRDLEGILGDFVLKTQDGDTLYTLAVEGRDDGFIAIDIPETAFADIGRYVQGGRWELSAMIPSAGGRVRIGDGAFTMGI